MAEILTANELESGATVYLTADGIWQMDIDKARLFEADDADARDAVLAAAQASGRLVGLEAEKVTRVDGRIVAQRLRERIRAEGPTSPYGPERQELEAIINVSL